MASSATPPTSSVTITRDGDWFVAQDEENGVASQGETHADPLTNLSEALELHNQPVDEPDVDWL